MALSVNAELAALLAAATDQAEWFSTFETAFATRRVVCKRNGTTFRDCALTGSMTFAGGAITHLGYTSDTTVYLAADLSTGSSVLRLESASHWMEGTLGLTASGCDFILDENPTTANGLAFSTVTINSPSSLAPDANQPYSATLVDWTSGSAGAEQTIYFDEDGGDIVWDDSELAAETGAVPYARSTEVFIHGTSGDAFEVGVHRFTLPASCNDEAAETVYQVLVAFSPYNRWAEYPAMATYESTTDSTFPKPFKIILKNASGDTLHTFEMHDGLPINDPSLGQTRNATTAFRPHVHCKMMLPWTSHRLAESSKARKYYPGVLSAYTMRPRMVHSLDSVNAVMPMFATERQQYNGIAHLMAMPPWGYSTSETGSSYPITDPYIPSNVYTYDPSGNATDGIRRPTLAVGYMYEPGSPSGHDWYPSPGGVRFDRYHVPSQLAMYMTDPTGSRVQGSVPYRTLADEYGKAYFNHGHHDITDARTLGMIPDAQAAYGLWAYTYGYYTPQGPVFVTGGTSRHIDTKTIINGETWPAADKDGKRHFNGWNVDNQHSYCQPGWYTLQFNSVIHMISAKLRWNAEWMSDGSHGKPDTTITGTDGYFLKRQHAWRFLHLAMMWKLGTTHAVGVSRAIVEDRWQTELEKVYTDIVLPCTDTGHASYNDIFFRVLRNFGVPGLEVSTGGGTQHYASVTTDAKLLYMVGVLALMKQTGSWAAMRAKSAECAAALDLILESVGKYSVTYLLATGGRMLGESNPIGATVVNATTMPVPADWYEWATTYAPVDGSRDLVTNSDGSPFSNGGIIERSSYQHMYMQAVFMFRDYFPEVAFPGVDDACTLCEGFEDTVAARVAAATTADYRYRHPAAGIFAVPDA